MEQWNGTVRNLGNGYLLRNMCATVGRVWRSYRKNVDCRNADMGSCASAD
jgi:hypothetical protein